MIESATAQRPGETATDRRELLAELFGVHRALGAIGNNVNQLARVANATGEIAEELGHTLTAVRRQLDRLDELMDRFEAT